MKQKSKCFPKVFYWIPLKDLMIALDLFFFGGGGGEKIPADFIYFFYVPTETQFILPVFIAEKK